jgi:hypothetical protein
MTTSYSVRRTINASPERIWALLTDGPAYPAWNPAVLALDGEIAVGEKIKLISVADPKRAFMLKVAEMAGPHHMVWSSGMPLGLFKGERTYSLRETGDGTEFSMEEVFSGALAPLITKSIPDMTDSFEQFADGLKAAAENGTSGG